MSHQRLGIIPDNEEWDKLVDRLHTCKGLAHEDIAPIVALALDAISPMLDEASNDVGLCYIFFILTQIAYASETADWQTYLATYNINLCSNSSIFDLTSQLQFAINKYTNDNDYCATDISELGQRAAGEALASLSLYTSMDLFNNDGVSLKIAVNYLSTPEGFSKLGQVFFGRFMEKFLYLYLNQLTTQEIVSRWIPGISEVICFNDALMTHCEQSARVVRNLCEQWYSETEYLKCIDIREASHFISIALKSLQDELANRGVELS